MLVNLNMSLMIAFVSRTYHNVGFMCTLTIGLPLSCRWNQQKLGFLARTKSALGYVSGAKYKASEMRRLVLNEAHRGRRRYKADHRGTNWVTMTESLVFFCGFPRFLRLFWLSDVVATMLPCVITNTKTSSVSVHPSKSCFQGRERCMRKSVLQ